MQATAPLNSGTPPERVKNLPRDNPVYPERLVQSEPGAAWNYAIISRNRAKRYAESCGPAAASG